MTIYHLIGIIGGLLATFPLVTWNKRMDLPETTMRLFVSIIGLLIVLVGIYLETHQ